MSRARVVATGGLAPMLAPQSCLIEVVDRDLILEGLRVILERRRHTEAK